MRRPRLPLCLVAVAVLAGACAEHRGAQPTASQGSAATPIAPAAPDAPKAATPAPAPAATAQALALQPAVTRAEIEAHVRYLASDELAGRKTGTEGAVRAAHYLAEVLERSGVEPAGDAGTYLQSVPLVRSVAEGVPELSLTGSEGAVEAVYGQDFDLTRRAAGDRTGLRIVYAASAAEIPKDGLADAALFLDAARGPARRWLEESGLAEGAGPAVVVLAGPAQPGEAKRRALGGDSLRLDRGEPEAGPAWIVVRGPLVERFRRRGIASLSLKSRVASDRPPAFNVLGRIRGVGLSGDATLADETVVLSAHYDHLGVLPAGSGTKSADGVEDRLYNGADDDASGCAAVLEIAGALAAGPKPARTVIVLLATGEEFGLLGTEHYLDHPAVPLDKTIANLNVEMIGRPDSLVGGAGKLWLTGYERSDLGPACAAAGIDVVADPRPDEMFFERSDNMAFVVRGIVGQTFSTYDLHEDYHHVTDEADRLDYAHMETCVRAVLGAVGLVTEGKLRPRWNAGFEPKIRKGR